MTKNIFNTNNIIIGIIVFVLVVFLVVIIGPILKNKLSKNVENFAAGTKPGAWKVAGVNRYYGANWRDNTSHPSEKYSSCDNIQCINGNQDLQVGQCWYRGYNSNGEWGWHKNGPASQVIPKGCNSDIFIGYASEKQKNGSGQGKLSIVPYYDDYMDLTKQYASCEDGKTSWDKPLGAFCDGDGNFYMNCKNQYSWQPPQQTKFPGYCRRDFDTPPTFSAASDGKVNSVGSPWIPGSGTFDFVNPPLPSPPPPPTYSVATSSTSINEGDSVTFTITTTNFGNGTLYYNLQPSDGLTADDFVDGSLSGPITITNNSGSVTKTLKNDLTTEKTTTNLTGTESFLFRLRTGSTSGTIVANGDDVYVKDTSLTPPPPPPPPPPPQTFDGQISESALTAFNIDSDYYPYRPIPGTQYSSVYRCDDFSCLPNKRDMKIGKCYNYGADKVWKPNSISNLVLKAGCDSRANIEYSGAKVNASGDMVPRLAPYSRGDWRVYCKEDWVCEESSDLVAECRKKNDTSPNPTYKKTRLEKGCFINNYNKFISVDNDGNFVVTDVPSTTTPTTINLNSSNNTTSTTTNAAGTTTTTTTPVVTSIQGKACPNLTETVSCNTQSCGNTCSA